MICPYLKSQLRSRTNSLGELEDRQWFRPCLVRLAFAFTATHVIIVVVDNLQVNSLVILELFDGFL